MNEHMSFDDRIDTDETNAVWRPEEIDAPEVWGIDSFDELLPDYVA